MIDIFLFTTIGMVVIGGFMIWLWSIYEENKDYHKDMIKLTKAHIDAIKSLESSANQAKVEYKKLIRNTNGKVNKK